MLGPAIYTGTLRHRRFRPKRHEFTYRVFLTFLDIDRIPELCRVSRAISYNRFNWASFDERDHFGDPRTPLRERLRADAARHGFELPDGPIYLLTHLRYLGYTFNPISLFYCYDAGGKPRLVLAEVRNTFGETCNYWLAVGPRRRIRVPKEMHVSPFNGMEMEYEFVLGEPGASLVAHMNTIEHGDAFFDATLVLRREPWSARSLRRALWRHPWMTAKVIGAIHWEALKLWIKGLPVYTHPARRGENA